MRTEEIFVYAFCLVMIFVVYFTFNYMFYIRPEQKKKKQAQNKLTEV